MPETIRTSRDPDVAREQVLKVRLGDRAWRRNPLANRECCLDDTSIDARLGRCEHRVRFVRDAVERVMPARAMRMREAAQARRQSAVERDRSTCRAREGVNPRHALGIEADADHRAWSADLVLVVRGHDDHRSAGLPDANLGVERDEQRDPVLRVTARKRSRRGANTDVIVENGTDPGIVQARHGDAS
jgi:hypothetical protein